MKLLVRQVRLAKRCWPPGDNLVADPSLVCPLCALEKHQAELSAGYSRQGYIRCATCDRLSAIYTPDGMSVVPLVSATRANGLIRALSAFETIRSALAGEVHLFDLVALDALQPIVEVTFEINTIVLTPDLTDADGAPLKAIDRIRTVPRRTGFPRDLEALFANA